MPDDPAQYYNLFSEWREHELRECVLEFTTLAPSLLSPTRVATPVVRYLSERGQANAPRNTPVELLRAQCADVAEAEVARQRATLRPRATAARQVAAPSRPIGGGGANGADGRKRAFIVGINYIGTRMQLAGCINDARCMHYLLRHRLGFSDDQILFMADDHPDPARRPTKANIIAGLRWLVSDLRTGDSLVFHYSGHGGSQRDVTGTERDGRSETLVPLDSTYAGQISDDMINQIIVRPLPQGVRLHAIIDACHSGTMLNLPFRAPCVGGTMTWHSEYPQHLIASKGTSGGFAVQFSASDDSEFAADTAALSGTGTPTGAATFSFIQAIERKGLSTTYGELVTDMFFCLANAGLAQTNGGYDPYYASLFSGGTSFKGQTPSISASYAFDLNFPLKL